MIITTIEEQRRVYEAARKVGGYQKLIELSRMGKRGSGRVSPDCKSGASAE